MALTSRSLVGPLALLLDAVEAVAQEHEVRREDAQPARRLVRPVVLDAERHALVVDLPREDRLPAQLDHLALQRRGVRVGHSCARHETEYLEGAVLFARLQSERVVAERRDHVALLAGVAAAVRENDLAVARRLSRQRQILPSKRDDEWDAKLDD